MSEIELKESFRLTPLKDKDATLAGPELESAGYSAEVAHMAKKEPRKKKESKKELVRKVVIESKGLFQSAPLKKEFEVDAAELKDAKIELVDGVLRILI